MTFRATGWRAFALLAAAGAALFVLPRALSAPPERADVEEAIRAAVGRQTWSERSGQTGEEIGRAYIDLGNRTFTDLTIRRSLVGPPFAYRWAYFVEAKVEPGGGVEYYRFSRGLATPTSRFWWRLGLF